MNQKNKNILKGVLFIIIPTIIILILGYYVQGIFTDTQVPITKSYGIIIDHPPKDFFDRSAQILVGFGLCLSSICWGAAKIIKELRRK